MTCATIFGFINFSNYFLSLHIIFTFHLFMQEMLCAIAEIASDRQILALRYDKKLKENKLGIMLVPEKTAEWIFRWEWFCI